MNFNYRLNEIIVRNKATLDMANRLEKDILTHCVASLEKEFVGHKFRAYIAYDDHGEADYLNLIDTMSISIDTVDGLLYLVDGVACSMHYNEKHKNVITVEKRPIPLEKLEQFVAVLSKEIGIRATMRTDDIKRYTENSVVENKNI